MIDTMKRMPYPDVPRRGVAGFKLQLLRVSLAEQGQPRGAGRLDVLQGCHLERRGEKCCGLQTAVSNSDRVVQR